MLHTVLLLDGSEAMNSGADYVPSYLLASRAPLLRFVSSYLDYTPLASLGVVVMRDGVSRRLCGCTTNSREIVDVLERDYFLHGGSGAMSLENGLRMALSELVDLRRVVSKRAALSQRRGGPMPNQHSTGTRGNRGSYDKSYYDSSSSNLVHPRVVILSASVTLIDPTDVMRVVRTVTSFGIEINIISFTGAVHAFEVCVRESGGTLYCPLSYDHLQRIMVTCAMSGDAVAAESAVRRGQSPSASPARLIPVGFPVYLTRSRQAPPAHRATHACASVARHSTTAHTDQDGHCRDDITTREYYLACPQCYFVQSAVPSTCPMCRLLLCSVPMMYTTFVAHNRLVPASRCDATNMDRTDVEDSRSDRKTGEGGRPSVAAAVPVRRCTLCTDVLSTEAAKRRCESCDGVRCLSCDEFVATVLRICPGCVTRR